MRRIKPDAHLHARGRPLGFWTHPDLAWDDAAKSYAERLLDVEREIQFQRRWRQQWIGRIAQMVRDERSTAPITVILPILEELDMLARALRFDGELEEPMERGRRR